MKKQTHELLRVLEDALIYLNEKQDPNTDDLIKRIRGQMKEIGYFDKEIDRK